MPDLLTINKISLVFGEIAALSDVSVAVAKGRVMAVIGPNGAGKTSLFNVISGFCRPNSGRVLFDNKDILTLPGHKRSTRGIARTFQNIVLFDGMSVLENLKLGAHAQLRANVLSAGIYMLWAKREEDDLTRRIERDVLTFLELDDVLDRSIGGFPYGVQKRFELARALVGEPRLLLVDEASLGLAPLIARDIFEILARINREKKLAILVVEQSVGLALKHASYGYILENGGVVLEGSADDLGDREVLSSRYLGGGAPRLVATNPQI